MTNIYADQAVTDAMREFEAVQWDNREFGAADTEPRGVLYAILEDIEWNGWTNKKVPTTVTGWQLFHGKKGATDAAKELAKAARKVVTAAKKAAK